MKRLFLLFLILGSCQKEQAPTNPIQGKDPNTNYILFGHYYGFCVGEKCVEIFKLTDASLYEDTLDLYPGSSKPYEGNFKMLDQAKFNMVRDLSTKIPAALLLTDTRVIGMPDAADGGGIYFELTINGERRFWLIDKMKDNQPEYLKSFVTEIESKIALLTN